MDTRPDPLERMPALLRRRLQVEITQSLTPDEMDCLAAHALAQALPAKTVPYPADFLEATLEKNHALVRGFLSGLHRPRVPPHYFRSPKEKRRWIHRRGGARAQLQWWEAACLFQNLRPPQDEPTFLSTVVTYPALLPLATRLYEEFLQRSSAPGA